MHKYSSPLYLVFQILIHRLTQAIMYTYVTLESQIDVKPSLDCGNSGLGLNLRVDSATGKLEEYCSNMGPFVRRYRIEVLMGHSGDESFQGTKWVKSQMHHDGYQLGNFDSVSRDDYMNGSTDARRSVRQRVWIQPDFRMVPIRDGDVVEEIVDESIEDTAEANVCRDTLGEHDALARDEDGEWCENHCTMNEAGNACMNSEKPADNVMCEKCWLSRPDKKDIEAVEVFNVSPQADGLYLKAGKIYVKGDDEYSLAQDRKGVWNLRHRDASSLLMSQSTFDPTPIAVRKWGKMKHARDGSGKKFVVSFAATVVESRKPIAAHNRHHWCAIARVGLSRDHVFELERQGASTEEIEQAEKEFEDAKRSDKPRSAVCWEGNPEREGCIAFHLGRGSAYVMNSRHNFPEGIDSEFLDSCREHNHYPATYEEYRPSSGNITPNECAMKCKNHPYSCRYFAVDSEGKTCNVYVRETEKDNGPFYLGEKKKSSNFFAGLADRISDFFKKCKIQSTGLDLVPMINELSDSEYELFKMAEEEE